MANEELPGELAVVGFPRLIRCERCGALTVPEDVVVHLRWHDAQVTYLGIAERLDSLQLAERLDPRP